MIYEYRCEDCREITEAYRTVADRENCPPCECGGQTKKIISGYHVHGDMEPYYDDNLQTYIRGKQHRQQVMKEQGLFENYGQGWFTSAKKRRIT
jgi:putative FmdB family regulatory protein